MRTKLVSIVIPTRNRENLLCDTIGYLFNQSYKNIEIIIIDQADSHSQATICFLNKVKDKIRYFHVREKGLPNARNVGINKAKGDIILFLDDDIIPDNDLVLYHLEAYEVDKKIEGVGGKVTGNEDYDIPKNVNKYCGVRLSGRVYMNRAALISMYSRSLPGGNMSFKKEIFEKVGHFDKNYIGNALLEETDFCYRVRKAGCKLYYEPKAKLHHLQASLGGCRSINMSDYNYFRFRNTMLFYLKNMRKIFLPYMIFVHLLVAIKKTLLSTRKMEDLGKMVKGLIDGFKVYKNGNY